MHYKKNIELQGNTSHGQAPGATGGGHAEAIIAKRHVARNTRSGVYATTPIVTPQPPITQERTVSVIATAGSRHKEKCSEQNP